MAIDYILKLIFPPKCFGCRRQLPFDTAMEVCKECYEKIPFTDSHTDTMLRHSLTGCDEVVCVCEYSGSVKEAIKRYKFSNKPCYHRIFAVLLEHKLKKVTDCRNFDIIVSVPLHKNKLRSRGYNQSQLIARELGRLLGVREDSAALVRVRDTQSQSLISNRDERHENVRDAFAVSDIEKVSLKSVLIIDDIMTTGSTLGECCRALKEAGAKKVTAAVIASGRKY
ncbi:MAG: ComF family protein [Clostridia bacterium]|nr:ComF family protein [Clostridia bacterium]